MTLFSSPWLRAVAALALISGTVAAADAQRGGGRGGGANRSAGAKTQHKSAGHHASTANRGAHHSGTANRTASANRNTNVNRSGNVNNVNVNRNLNVSGNGYGYGSGYHPVARGAAVGAMAVTTGAVLGSMYHTLPSSCVTVVRVGVTYHQCGSAWYQSQGGEYVVVAQP